MPDSDRNTGSAEPDVAIAATPIGEEQLRVDLRTFRGHTAVHVRRWYPSKDGRFLPGKGAGVPVRLIPWLRAAVERAEKVALSLGLLSPDDYTAAGVVPPVGALSE